MHPGLRRHLLPALPAVIHILSSSFTYACWRPIGRVEENREELHLTPLDVSKVGVSSETNSREEIRCRWTDTPLSGIQQHHQKAPDEMQKSHLDSLRGKDSCEGVRGIRPYCEGKQSKVYLD